MTDANTDSSAKQPDQPKAPSAFTEAANSTAASSAPQISFDDPGDFGRASEGLLAQIDDGRVMMGDHVVFDVARHGFVNETEQNPASVHPGLWRQAKLNTNHGLFQVAEGVWQVRGYDIANITFMAGSDGWLVIDPLTNAPSAAAALKLANDTLGERPVSSIIYTHSHVDHFGGVMGVTSQEAVDAGDVQIVAPEGFLREVINEFVIAGPIMGRRAAYQFGPLLPPGPRGHVDSGLGSAMGLARSDLIAPTIDIEYTGQEIDLNGLRIVFQMTPDAEAPAEMNFFFPDIGSSAGGSGGSSGPVQGLLCMAENCTHTLHNLYPIRGAQTRDALAWSKYIQEALLLWGDRAHTTFASHHWPRFGNEDSRKFLEMQRDVYRWMHDQTMRLANNGKVPTEIAAELEMPTEFTESHVRGYYGTVSHNVRSVYNRYLGWYDGNPAHLDPLPPVDGGKKYVEFMGGADGVLRQARQSFDEGDYRWVVEVVNHVVFADPENRAARQLQADALEQLGYQAESATWRNAYLMGAKELREGSPQWGRVPTRDMSNAMTAEQIFDIIGVRFNPGVFTRGQAQDAVAINWYFADLEEHHLLGIGRSAINHVPGGQSGTPDVSVTITRPQLVKALEDATALDEAEITGDRALLVELLESLEIFTTAALIEP
ncbi:MAG: alkyl/aryl-sulfatase [Acidimicrobiales bacterium]